MKLSCPPPWKKKFFLCLTGYLMSIAPLLPLLAILDAVSASKLLCVSREPIPAVSAFCAEAPQLRGDRH